MMDDSTSDALSLEDQYQLRLKELEIEELRQASATTNEACSHYSQMMALYLYFHDLNNARFLWKRIPKQVKESENASELALAWAVGQKMFTRDRVSAFAELAKGNWESSTSPVAGIMMNLKRCLQDRALSLIGRVYTSISLLKLTQALGLSTPEEAIQRLQTLGWQYDSGTHMVTPKPTTEATGPAMSNSDQLTILNKFVSYLEN